MYYEYKIYVFGGILCLVLVSFEYNKSRRF
jgi:hypothetical protein